MADAADPRDRLFMLLPAIYRERDATLGDPLRSLLRIVQTQSDLVEADVRQLWDDFFIETCEPWVIPYLGDLVGNLPMFDASRIRQPLTAEGLFPDLTGPRLTPEVALRSRADVAKTIYYRRRKSTLPMLEELARDVTGWAAHAAEMFERLGWTQCVRNHLRPASLRTPDLRPSVRLDLLDGPFDTAAHTVDVRPIAQLTGWHGIKNLGFFLWRLGSYEMTGVQARAAAVTGYGYTFSPLGNPAPLFSRWRREGDDSGLATELFVPGPIRPLAFCDDLRRHLDPAAPPPFTDFYGLFEAIHDPTGTINPSKLPPAPGSSFQIFRDGAVVPAQQVRCMDLATWRQPVTSLAAPFLVGVDVARGRMAFSAGFEPTLGVKVDYHYGFSADLGGGPYQRAAWLERRDGVTVIEVDQSGATPGAQTSLGAALLAWPATPQATTTVISILDDRTYEETVTINLAGGGRRLVIEAADEVRPHLKLNGPLKILGKDLDASVTLSGLLVEGTVEVTGQPGRLRLLHTTLVPGGGLQDDGSPVFQLPSLSVAEADGAGVPINEELAVEIAFSITGPLRIPRHALGLWLLDSIVDGIPPPPPPPRLPMAAISNAAGTSGPPAWLERVTVLGPSLVKELTIASEVIFGGAVHAERLQEGCVRFSWVAPGSRTPRRYHCQPDLEIDARAEQAKADAAALGTTPPPGFKDAIRQAVEAWLVPSFTAHRYGLPAYAQLHLTCPAQIGTGAEDGSEMGAFCHLKQPQREANLRLRLEEYLPFGLEAGLIYVT